MQDRRELTVGYYLLAIRRQWVTVLAIMVLVTGAAGALAFTAEPRFEAQANVTIRTQSNQQLFVAAGTAASSLMRQPVAEVEFAQSDLFAGSLPPTDGVAVSTPDEKTFGSSPGRLEFRARAGNVNDAIAAANRWAAAYVEQRHALDVEQNATAIASLEADLDDLNELRDRILEPLEPLDDALAVASDPDVVTRLTTQRVALLQSLSNELQPIEADIRLATLDVSSLRSTQRFLDDVESSARVTRTASDARQLPPRPAQTLTLAVAVGLLLAVPAAVVNDMRRDRITSGADLEELAPTVPVLAEVPMSTGGIERPDDASGPVLDAVERLATSLVFLRQTSDIQRFMVTSSNGGEGKSTLSALLARRIALQGLKVCLIDADLRRGRQHELHDVPLSPGLSEFLTTRRANVLRTVGIQQRVQVRLVTSGQRVSNPAGLLRGPGLPLFLDAAAEGHEIVVIDAPPVLPVTDAQVLADGIAEGVIVLVRAGATARKDVAETLRNLSLVNANVLGLVLVGTKARSSYYHTGADAQPSANARTKAPLLRRLPGRQRQR